MYASNSVQALINDLGDVIASGPGPDASSLERVFTGLLSFNFVLWLFLPILFVLALWQLVSMAGRMSKVHTDLYRLTIVLNDAIREQTAAIHHLRDKLQTTLEATQTSVDSHRDGVQQGARDIVKAVEALDRHQQGGAADIQKPIANIYDRLGALLALRPGAELDRPECNGDNP